MRATRPKIELIIDDIKLEVNGTDETGIRLVGESLAIFAAMITPIPITMTSLNESLEACGIKPITLEQIRIIGVYRDKEKE